MHNFPAGIYRHHKGGLYHAIGVAEISDNDFLQRVSKSSSIQERTMVVYFSLKSSLPGIRFRVRSWKEWEEIVTWPDGRYRPRFQYLGIGIPEGMETT